MAKLSLESVVKRIEAIPAAASLPDPVAASVLFGTAPAPCITITYTLELPRTLARENTFGKSDNLLRRWEAWRRKAIRNFMDIAVDKEITRDDILDFRILRLRLTGDS